MFLCLFYTWSQNKHRNAHKIYPLWFQIYSNPRKKTCFSHWWSHWPPSGTILLPLMQMYTLWLSLSGINIIRVHSPIPQTPFRNADVALSHLMLACSLLVSVRACQRACVSHANRAGRTEGTKPPRGPCAMYICNEIRGGYVGRKGWEVLTPHTHTHTSRNICMLLYIVHIISGTPFSAASSIRALLVERR